jgi:hypothetical protein
LLQGQNLFFYGIFGDEFVNEHVFGLANAVCTVNGLLLNCRVPPWVEDKYIIGLGEVKPTPPAFIEIRNTRFFILLEAASPRRRGFGCCHPGIRIGNALLIKMLAVDLQLLYKLREDQHLVPAIKHIGLACEPRFQTYPSRPHNPGLSCRGDWQSGAVW